MSARLNDTLWGICRASLLAFFVLALVQILRGHGAKRISGAYGFLAVSLLGIAIALVAVLRAEEFLTKRKYRTPEQRRAWLVQAVRYYRGLEFFVEYEGLTDRDAASRLSRRYRTRYGKPVAPYDEWVGLNLLALDKRRVWYQDTEFIVPGGREYATAIRALSSISLGAFAPSNVVETWETERGPIRVELSLDGSRHAISPKYRLDWFDPKIIDSINELLPDSERQFCYASVDQEIAVVMLSPAERESIGRTYGVWF